MAASFEMDLRKFIRAIEEVPEIVASAAKRGLHDVMDEWKRDAIDVAPVDKSTLIKSVSIPEITGSGVNLTGEFSANAVEVASRGKWAGKRFNYAYYIHEKDAGGRNLRKPGAVKKFLEVPLEKSSDKWVRDIENEISGELKRKGWR
jgi:hypothetical protein